MPRSRPNTHHGYTACLALTVSLFALWGFGQQLSGTLESQLAAPLHLEGLERTLSQSLTGIVYFFCALPAAYYARRFGYKASILFGLGCICLSSFTLYPTAGAQTHGYFLGALTAMAIGWIILEVAANPLAASLGPEKTFVWRLNLAQAVFPLGALAGTIAGQWLLRAHLAVPVAKATYTLAHPYILLGAGVLVLIYLFEEVRFPPALYERQRSAIGADLLKLLTRPLFLFALAAQSFSVVILVCNWTNASHFFPAAFPHHAGDTFIDIFFWASVVYAAGRFAGCGLMRFVEPATTLAIFAGGGVVCAVIAATGGTTTAAIAILASQFCASIIWPTVLGLAIVGSGSLMKLGTALICMAGALGGVAHQTIAGAWPLSTGAELAVAGLSYAVVAAFALCCRRTEAD